MARPVRSAREAVAIARNLAQDAGLLWFNVTNATRKGYKWIVNVDTFGVRYQAVISGRTGEVLEWKRSQRRS